jgi:hypothetical protein
LVAEPFWPRGYGKNDIVASAPRPTRQIDSQGFAFSHWPKNMRLGFEMPSPTTRNKVNFSNFP